MNPYEALAEQVKQRDSKKIDHNTYAYTRLYGFSVELHAHEIAVVRPNYIQLYTQGWYTPTTKDRLNKLLNLGASTYDSGRERFRIGQEHGIWYLWRWQQMPRWDDQGNRTNGIQEEYVFAEGVKVFYDGHVEDARSVAAAKSDEKVRKAIHTYARAYAKKLIAGKVPKPSNADCMYCAMEWRDTSGNVVEPPDDSHIVLHVAEKYYVPSLLARAHMEFGDGMFSQMDDWNMHKLWYAEEDELTTLWAMDRFEDRVAKLLFKYMDKHWPKSAQGDYQTVESVKDQL